LLRVYWVYSIYLCAIEPWHILALIRVIITKKYSSLNINKMNLLQEARNLYDILDQAFDTEENRHTALQIHLLAEEMRELIYLVEMGGGSEHSKEIISDIRKQFRKLPINKKDDNE